MFKKIGFEIPIDSGSYEAFNEQNKHKDLV